MGIAWQITIEDIQLVLNAHNVPHDDEDKLNALLDSLDHHAIESMILDYTDMDDQTAAMLSSIEDQFLSKGIIAGPKKFN